jgi:hypothetical protein
MSKRYVTVLAELTLQELVDHHILGTGRRCFVVSLGTDNVGLITLHQVKEVPGTEWVRTTAREVMFPLDQLKWIVPEPGWLECISRCSGPWRRMPIPERSAGETRSTA